MKAIFIKTSLRAILKKCFPYRESTFCMHYAKTKFQRNSNAESRSYHPFPPVVFFTLIAGP